MASSASRFLSLWVLLFSLAAFPMRAFPDKFQITSDPPGATVEINGGMVGTTPYTQEVPGGYFHRTKTAFGARLGHAMIARLTLAGYEPVEIVLTDGPANWISIKNHNYGPYWLIKTDHFHIRMNVSEFSAEEIPRLPMENVVAPKNGTLSPSTVDSARVTRGTGTIIFDEPSGAGIWVDHKFVGNIPATLKLPAGDHLVTVRMTGRADWVRNVNLLRDSQVHLTVTANHEP